MRGRIVARPVLYPWDVLRSWLPLSIVGLVTACAEAPGGEPIDPNEGLLRDFLDGKFDGAGHPLNAKVVRVDASCQAGCDVEIPDGATTGELVLNVRLRVIEKPSSGSIVKARILDGSGEELVEESLTVSRLRGRAGGVDLAVQLQNRGTAAKLRIEPQQGAQLEVEYVEVFPKKFGLVVAPGSGVIGDGELLTIEMPRLRALDRLEADGVDLLPALDSLLDRDIAVKTSTAFRTLIEVPVGELLPQRADIVELHVRGAGDAARVQLRRAPAACNFEGDPFGTRVLVTGFQPFPADGTHDNISAVAVMAMNPANVRGAQVMRMVLPVEYDRAPAMIGEVIERCEPEVVISFGQGGGHIALEQTAHNLQDTGEISGGVPDNRGVIRAATQIDPTAGAERSTLLPLDAIRAALEGLGEAPMDSTDPGRYICNNTMWNNIGVMTARGGRGGFIHLPFTAVFDDAVEQRFARVVEAAIQATVED